MKFDFYYLYITKLTLTMTDFALYEEALEEYNNNKISNKTNNKKNTCQHNDIVTENDVTSCLECGEQIQRTIMHEKEWRFYGHTDSKRSSDPNRVQMRKSEERNINKDVENMGFSETIVTTANEIYISSYTRTNLPRRFS